MARVNRRSGSSSTSAEQARRNAAAAERRQAAAQARQQQAAALERRRDTFTGARRDGLMRNYNGGADRDIGRLANGSGATRTNRDGSQTTDRQTRRRGATVDQSLTTRGGLGRSGAVRFDQTTTRANGTGTTSQRYEADRDFFGRTSSTQTRETAVTRRGRTETDSRSTATDTRGRRTVTDTRSTATERGATTTTESRSTVRGRGTRQSTQATEEVRQNGEHDTTTRARSTTTGTATTHTDAQLTAADGRLSLGSSVDRRTERRFDSSFERTRGAERPQDDSITRQDRVQRAQGALDTVAALGVPRHDLIERIDAAPSQIDAIRENPNGDFAGGLAETNRAQHLDVGINGASGQFMRSATAGLYAQHNRQVEGALGTAGYQAAASLEATASLDATGTVDSNGVNLSATARASVSAEASIAGQAHTQPAHFLGEDLTLGVEGRAAVRAEATAEATGGVRVTRNPLTAIAEGSAGVSAVVRAEAEVTASAGPFSVRASGYASAGAEARATGVIGYEDGRLRIGGSLGAALGVGLGGAVNVEVDVAQIGRMAHTAADRDGDGRLGLNDVRAGAQQVATAAHAAADRDGDGRLGLNDVGAGARQAAAAATSTVANAGRRVASWFGW